HGFNQNHSYAELGKRADGLGEVAFERSHPVAVPSCREENRLDVASRNQAQDDIVEPPAYRPLGAVKPDQRGTGAVTRVPAGNAGIGGESLEGGAKRARVAVAPQDERRFLVAAA